MILNGLSSKRKTLYLAFSLSVIVILICVIWVIRIIVIVKGYGGRCCELTGLGAVVVFSFGDTVLVTLGVSSSFVRLP